MNIKGKVDAKLHFQVSLSLSFPPLHTLLHTITRDLCDPHINELQGQRERERETGRQTDIERGIQRNRQIDR